MEARKDNAKSQFDSWSGWYDRSLLQRIFFGPTHAAMLESLDRLPANSSILDVGCGTGLLAAKMLASSPTNFVVGIDLSSGMIEQAQQSCQQFGAQARFVVGDSEHLPFPNSSFDALTCSHSFHHYPNQESVVREFARVLKPNGMLLLADANRDGLWGWALFDGFVNWLEGGVSHCSAAKFRDLFADAGFEMVTQRKGGWIMPWMVNHAVRRRVVVSTPRRAA
jgi:ubiquinone/menaquinone biosynthesis C-methylase UbiE